MCLEFVVPQKEKGVAEKSTACKDKSKTKVCICQFVVFALRSEPKNEAALMAAETLYHPTKEHTQKVA
jgi:hypothetical protein